MKKAKSVVMTSTQPDTLYTFGYGNRQSIDPLLDYCHTHHIDAVIDVRLKPYGWANMWSLPGLSKILPSEGIVYQSYPALGNTSGSEHWVPPSFTDSEAAFAELTAMAESKTLVLMCAELDHNHCHRNAVAEVLAKRAKLQIKHLP